MSEDYQIDLVREPGQAVRVATDTVDSNIKYIGCANPGVTESQAFWRIMKVDKDSGIVITWADGNEIKDNIWNDREDLTYS